MAGFVSEYLPNTKNTIEIHQIVPTKTYRKRRLPPPQGTNNRIRAPRVNFARIIISTSCYYVCSHHCRVPKAYWYILQPKTYTRDMLIIQLYTLTMSKMAITYAPFRTFEHPKQHLESAIGLKQQ